jgi:PiT family inorganic phosphate transporter
VVTIFVALAFDFANGWNDSANAIATVVATHTLTPRQAVLLAAVLNFVGILLGTAVAHTIGKGIVHTEAVSSLAVLAAMLSAFAWTSLMTVVGMPISASHALVGGLTGAAAASPMGLGAIQAGGAIKVLAALLVSPLAGFVIGMVLMLGLLWIVAHRPHGKVNRFFGRLQLISVSWMAVTHGANDAQKVMGVITMALVAAKVQSDFHVPLWVKIVCHAAIALGTAVGGWKVIRTLGSKLTGLEKIHGFAAETAASAVLLGTALVGVPVSTTHTITGAIIGVGSSRSLSAVRWGLGLKILWAWILTLPCCFAVGWVFRRLLELVLS